MKFKGAFIWSLLSLFSLAGTAQAPKENTLLWRISGNQLKAPSYLFGTIHMICGDDIQISDSLSNAISKADDVYLELDMDNIVEMMSVMTKMKMRNDTTLSELLTPEEYQKVKKFFDEKGGLLSFSMMEKYKPMLTASTLMQSEMACDNAVAMEQLIMNEARMNRVSIKGLETMAYQMSIFDSIPYKVQAKQLVEYIDNFDDKAQSKEFEKLSEAYRKQELNKLEALIANDQSGMEQYSDLLLFNRNKNWVKKLAELLPEKRLVIAVGAGHLPGEKGLINLLRKAGYKVEPVKNNMIRSKTKEI
jgi:uncharacterized protein